MSSSDQDKQRNREIAENEANRQVVGDVRVSVWAIAVTVVAGDRVRHRWAWLNAELWWIRAAAYAQQGELALSTSLRAKRSNPLARGGWIASSLRSSQ